jgi:uncharacterized protein (DUF2147 family)
MVEGRLRAFIYLLALIGAFVFAQTAAAAEVSPAGRWVSIDDKDGKPRSVIEIADLAGTLQAKVVQIYDRPGDNPGHLCKKCNGELKNKPVLGMMIMMGLKRDGDVWDGGTILDPDSGNTYSAKLQVVDGGQKLEVRGYLGISLFGRSQTWVREAAK